MDYDKSQCPLCGSVACTFFSEDATRCYVRCRSCRLIFVPEHYWLSLEEERATYDLHENSADDPGYRRFLSRLTNPLLEQLGPRRSGLDFGCGPGPTLSIMLEEQGHEVELYDPFYANHPSALKVTYDFICATEVVEHFREPLKEFKTLFSLLKPGGTLGIMTKLVSDDLTAFQNWHYIRDLTHICFYHRDTFEWIAERFDAKVKVIGVDVILMQVQEP